MPNGHVVHYNNPRSTTVHTYPTARKVMEVANLSMKGYKAIKAALKSKAINQNLLKLKKDKGTPTRKTEPVVQEVQQHSGLSEATIKVNGGALRLKKGERTVGHWDYTQTFSGISVGTAGAQTAFDVVTINSTPQILISNGLSYGFYQNCTSLREMNSYQLTTGSSGAAGTILPGGIIPQNDQFIILNNQVQMEITNFSAVGVVADVYLCKSKIADSQSALTVWNRGLQNQAVGQPAAAKPAPGTSIGGVGYPDSTYIGQRPTQAKLFRDYWKVCAVKHLDLSSNATQVIKFDIGLNARVICEDAQEMLNATNIFSPKTTYQLLMVHRGQLVEDTTNTSAALVTYGSTKIGWATTTKTVMCGVAGNSARLNVSRAIQNIPAGASTVNQRMISEIDNPVAVGAVTL